MMKHFFLCCFFFLMNDVKSAIKIDSLNIINSRCLNNGSVTIFATSTSPVFYSIVSGPLTFLPQSVNVFSGLSAGNYKIMVLNSSGEKDSMNFTITSVYVPPTFNPIIRNTSCKNNSDGSVIGNMTSNSSIKPVKWTLKNIQTNISIVQWDNDTFLNLGKGDYVLTAYDSCLNTTVRNFEVKNTNPGFVYFNSFPPVRAFSCDKAIFSGNFRTINNAYPVLAKYVHKRTGAVYKIVPDSSGIFPYFGIYDTIPFSLRNNDVIEITLYNACGDSIKKNDLYSLGFVFSSRFLNCDTNKVKLNFTFYAPYGDVYLSNVNIKTPTGISVMVNKRTTDFDTILSNIKIGDTIISTAYTTCGDSFKVRNIVLLSGFGFKRNESIRTKTCDSSGYVYNYMDTTGPGQKFPYIYNLIDKLTGNIVYTGQGPSLNGPSFGYQKEDRVYIFVAIDSCGKIYKDSFYWKKSFYVSTFKSISISKKYDENCLDSTLKVVATLSGAQGNISVQEFKGPNLVMNKKPKYEYVSSTNKVNGQVFTQNSVVFSNLGVGKYYITLVDLCTKDILKDSFEVFRLDVMSVNHTFTAKRFCEDLNELSVKLYSTYTWATNSHEDAGWYSVYNIKTQKFITPDTINFFQLNPSNSFLFSDHFKYLKEGQYVLRIRYNQVSGIYKNNPDGVIYTSTEKCTEVNDTIIIQPYLRPRVKAVYKIRCKESTFVVVEADSLYGTFPYKYEINKGPQIFPKQASNIFKVNKYGSFQAQITDTCGNANTIDFKVDSIALYLNPLSDTSCENLQVNFSFINTPNISYLWKKPDGSYATGSSLYFNPVMPKDIGKYYVTQYINFEGCQDTVNHTLNMVKSKLEIKYDTLRDGDSVLFESKYLKLPGIYSKTISQKPCDSLFQYRLIVLDTTILDTVYGKLCKGGTFKYGKRILKSPGYYYDTIVVFNIPDTVRVLVLTVSTQVPVYMDSTIVVCDSLIHRTGIFKSSQFKIDSFALSSKVAPFCDSIIYYLHVVVFYSPVLEISADAPNPLQYSQLIKLSAQPKDPSELRYQWENGDDKSYKDHIASKNEVIRVAGITKEGCFGFASYNVEMNPDDNCHHDVPNIFTPNQDQMNDVFRIKLKCATDSYRLKIYNRWGERVFYSEDAADGWDGFYNGIPQTVGSYIYYLEYKRKEDGKMFQIMGGVTLVR